MSLRNIGIVYRKELTEALRDRRTLTSSILMPLLIFPVITVGFGTVASTLVGRAKKEAPKIMILGGENSPQVLAAITDVDEGDKLEAMEVVPRSSDYANQINEKKIRAAVEIPPGFQAALEKGEAPEIKIHMYQNELKSDIAAKRIEKSLEKYRDQIAQDRIAAKNLPASTLKPFAIERHNVAPPEKTSGAVLGGLIGYMVIMLCMAGAIYPAIDITAGEKERGTMETILTSPVSRTHLVLGKFFLVLTASLTSAVLSVISMGTSFLLAAKFGQAGGGVGEGKDEAFVLALSLKSVFGVLVMALPVAVLFSAVLLTVALFAKSSKEAQSYVTPMMFLVIIPAIASFLPGVELDLRLALIPLLNTSLVCKEIVSGTYHWNFMALIFASTCVYAAAAIFIAVKMFQREDVLFRA